MPIYEYQCDDCGHQLEAIQKFSDGPLVDCPACGRPALRKLISAAGFRLKGGGWYETDFKTGKKRNVVDTGDAGSGGAEKKDAGSGKKPGTGKSADAGSKNAAAGKPGSGSAAGGG